MTARETLGILTAALLLVTAASSFAQTTISSPDTFPSYPNANTDGIQNVNEDRRTFAAAVFSHLERKLRTQYEITLHQPRERLNTPPNPQRFSDHRGNNNLYGYYLPDGSNPYRYFVGCSEPDPDKCERIDLSKWQNAENRFEDSADGIADRIINALYRQNTEESSGDSYSLLSYIGLGSAGDSRTISVKLTERADTDASDTTVLNFEDGGPLGEPASFSPPTRTEGFKSSLPPTTIKHEAAIHEIILLISREKFHAASRRLDNLDSETRNHPRLTNLIQQLKQLTRISTDSSGN